MGDFNVDFSNSSIFKNNSLMKTLCDLHLVQLVDVIIRPLFISVSSHYGFGLMDAGRMVEYAKKWRSVPKQVSCEVNLNISK